MAVVNKNEFRKKILARLKSQKESMRLSKSLAIKRRLFNLSEFRDAGIILFYASFDGEVDTLDMIKEAQQMGKSIGLPKIDRQNNLFMPILTRYLDKELASGAYGIKEPISSEGKTLSLEDIDLVIVPGVAFDKENNRLGRGKGYYDRFLKMLPASTPTVGLAFDFQIVNTLPFIEPHDVPVSQTVYN